MLTSEFELCLHSVAQRNNCDLPNLLTCHRVLSLFMITVSLVNHSNLPNATNCNAFKVYSCFCRCYKLTLHESQLQVL
jgi:hypothetical protein